MKVCAAWSRRSVFDWGSCPAKATFTTRSSGESGSVNGCSTSPKGNSACVSGTMIGLVTCDVQCRWRRAGFRDLVWEFPGGDLRSELEPLVGIRALMRVARLWIQEQPVELLNREEKTVFRFDLTACSQRARQQSPSTACVIFVLSGAMKPKQPKRSRFCGRLAPRRSVKVRWQFSSASGARHLDTTHCGLRSTCGRICRCARRLAESFTGCWRSRARTRLASRKTSIPSSCDYRICMRKIRSVLSLLKGIYPEEKTNELKVLFARYCDATNKLRDLDVYLLAREQYAQMLPEALRPPLQEVFHDFGRERRRALRKVVRDLSSTDYRASIEKVERFFSAAADIPETDVSREPAGPLIAQRIYKRYKRILKIERGLGSDTPDEVLHKVRIHCKKLRYLIEFFSELLPEGETEQIEKQLRRLQTCLGVFNDCSVQQRSLLQYWERKRQEER